MRIELACGRTTAALILGLFSTFCAFGQSGHRQTEALAPPQPLIGPGGKIAPFSGMMQFGPYLASESESTSDFYIFQPSGKTVTSLPVVLFVHGALLNTEGAPVGDQPSNYQGWINQLVFKGYTVVFPISFDSASPNTWLPVLTEDWIAAIGLLQSKAGGLVPPSTDENGVQAFCAGHSYGAYDCFTLLQSLYLEPKPNAPLLRAISAMNPALGAPGRALNLTSIPPSTYVVEVKSDEEVLNQLQTADQLWQFLEAQIPSSQRDYLELVTDRHGIPAQIGNHCWPLTNGFQDDTTIDDRDFNVSYKLTVGLFNCVAAGKDCNYGLGHGNSDQINMGHWSDGVPVTPLLWNPPFTQ